MGKKHKLSNLSVINKTSWIFLLIVSLLVGCAEKKETGTKKTLKDFGIRASNLFFYYKDLDRAARFYTETLGIQIVADYGMAKILRVAPTSYLILVDETKGMHSYTEQKGVTVSFIIEKIEDWFDYVQKHQPFELRSKKLEEGTDTKYRAFVGYDPEGYFMEFDKFYHHSSQVELIKYLEEAELHLDKQNGDK